MTAAQANKPEIFTSRNCGWAQRNYAAMLEKGQPFSLVSSRGPHGEKTEEFLSLTPLGLTPVLRDGISVVMDSTLINLYIDANFGGQPLMPVDSADATMALCQAHYCDRVLHPALSSCLDGRVDANDLSRPFQLLNGRTFFEKTGGPYWYGEQFTIVDISFVTFFSTLNFVEQQGIAVRAQLSDRVLEWEKHIVERPSIVRAAELADEFRDNPTTIYVSGQGQSSR